MSCRRFFLKAYTVGVKLMPSTGGPSVWRAPVFLLCLGALFVLDMLTRFLCFAGKCQDFSYGWIGLSPFPNYHFAFSVPIPGSAMYILYVAVLCVVIPFIVQTWKRNDWRVNFSWMLICIGATANIVDRIYFGYVRDFIQVHTAFFNLGDVWIVVGILFISWRSFGETSKISL